MTGKKLTEEEGKEFGLRVMQKLNEFTSKWKVYSSTTTPPTEAGRYVMTVCILGGNYLASPINRSFQITK